MAETTNTLAVAPPLLTVRVLLYGPEPIPVKGLFIAFKLKPANPDDKAARLAESLRDDFFQKMRDDTPAKKRNKAWEARYDRIFNEYQAQLAETVDDPADRYVLGITDIDGYLEPVYDSSNPWRDRYARLEPDTFKFALGETYSAYLIRHPSPDLARAVTRALNGEDPGRPDVNLKDATLWGDAPQTFTVKAGSGEDGEQFVIHLPSVPSCYVPLRPDDPQKWWLYAGMPHDTVDTVRTQIEHTVTRLGLLKYPATGNQDYPYAAEVNEFHAALHASAGRYQEHLAEGKAFHPADWEKAHNRSTWGSEIGDTVTFDPAPVPRLEQGGVIGPFTDARIDEWLANKWTKPGEHLVTIGFDPPPGIRVPRYEVLMLARGAFAVNAWGTLNKALGGFYGICSGHSYRTVTAEGGGGAIKNSIHKTGLAIDLTGARQRTTKPNWPVRFEAEFRRIRQKVTLPELEAKQTEKETALKAAKTAREDDREKAAAAVTKATQELDALKNPADPKKKPTKLQLANANTKLTNAKTAHANIDKKHAPAIDKATRELETAKANVEAMKEAIRNDSDRLPNRWAMRFRLYAHSAADVFNPNYTQRAAARTALKPAIAAWAGIPWPLPADRPENAGIDGTFAQFVRQTYLAGIPREKTDPWFAEQFKYAYAFAKKLLDMPDDEIVSQFFRESITQWRVNFYERDGGSDMAQSWKAHEGNEDFPAWPTAKSWINLSAIGHGCRMHRIPPHSMDCRDKLTFADDKSKYPPMAFPMANYLKFEASKAEQGDIVAAIEDITASAAQAPELAHKDFVVQFGYPKNKKLELDVEALPKEIDAAFFKEWRRLLAGLDSPGAVLHPPGTRTVYKPLGAAVSLELNPDRQTGLAQAYELFGTTCAARRFHILEAGSLLATEFTKGAFLTGAALRKAAEDAVARLAALRTAERQKAEADAKAEADRIAAEKEAAKKAGKKYKPTPKKEVPKPPPPKVEDWSVLIQPVFTVGNDPKPKLLFLPGHSVLLPARENAAHLEWWHYQHNSVKEAGTWKELLKECGFSAEVMSVPMEGAPEPSGEPIHIGLGYTDSEMNSHPWPSASEIDTQPPNRDAATDEAVEVDPDNEIE